MPYDEIEEETTSFVCAALMFILISTELNFLSIWQRCTTISNFERDRVFISKCMIKMLYSSREILSELTYTICSNGRIHHDFFTTREHTRIVFS